LTIPSRFIDAPNSIAAELANYDVVGVDTEFMREKTFFAQLCLLQVATPDCVWCVDPLGDKDMGEFWARACQREWVVHSARQDIEVVFQSTSTMPAALFDTQVAAALLGMQPQIGYAGLVKSLFNVELPKSHTRANWAQRPLPEALLHYAVEDVEYLLPAYEELRKRLDELGRLEWARQDSALLLDESLYAVDESQAIARLKGAKNLRGRRRAAATRLATWRESEAVRRDKPRQWILRDAVLLEIAGLLPKTTNELRAIENMPPKLVQRAGDELLEIVARSGGDEVDYRPPGVPDEQQKRLLKSMQATVSDCADELGLSAETIASRKELSAVINSGKQDSRVFSGWRRELVGERLLELL
jgi:ribonuclease D